MPDVFKINLVDPDKLREYIKRHRSGDVQRSLDILFRNLKFTEAWNSEIGYEILKDACSMHYEALCKIATFEATDSDKATYQALDTLLQRWATRIATYEELAKKVNGA
jgi:uncharacterized protein YutE (UPF0331/DUF86 family)